MTPPIHCSPLSLLTFSLIKNTNSLQWNKIKPNCSFNSFTQKKKKKQISLLHFFTSREKFKFSSIEINIHKLVCTKRLLNQDYYTTSSRKKISKPKLRYQSRTILSSFWWNTSEKGKVILPISMDDVSTSNEISCRNLYASFSPSLHFVRSRLLHTVNSGCVARPCALVDTTCFD